MRASAARMCLTIALVKPRPSCWRAQVLGWASIYESPYQTFGLASNQHLFAVLRIPKGTSTEMAR